ncbi:hypothetical protein LTS18_012122 [Coniosporium uncinatum]|uniref:Uncharacterized protein n=1 Tax=Coniosporium uncinatum TaxID=93489 RepID=A0ACC3D9J2_9PEZI|nr:hypothetical protein LTS18_012122 [Coniosporium uncinatum]
MAPKKAKANADVGRARSDLDRFRSIARARVRRRLRRQDGGREPSDAEFNKEYKKIGVMGLYRAWKRKPSTMDLDVEDARPVDYNSEEDAKPSGPEQGSAVSEGNLDPPEEEPAADADPLGGAPAGNGDLPGGEPAADVGPLGGEPATTGDLAVGPSASSKGKEGARDIDENLADTGPTMPGIDLRVKEYETALSMFTKKRKPLPANIMEGTEEESMLYVHAMLGCMLTFTEQHNKEADAAFYRLSETQKLKWEAEALAENMRLYNAETAVLEDSDKEPVKDDADSVEEFDIDLNGVQEWRAQDRLGEGGFGVAHLYVRLDNNGNIAEVSEPSILLKN